MKKRTWAVQEISCPDSRVLARLGFHIGDEDGVKAHLEAVAGEPLGVVRTFSVTEGDRVRVRLTQMNRQGAARCWHAVELMTHHHV